MLKKVTVETAAEAYLELLASRGVEYLLRNQEYDGSWKDGAWTGTGFPKVFYLRYHLYATYFPLWALSLYSGRGSEGRAIR